MNAIDKRDAVLFYAMDQGVVDFREPISALRSPLNRLFGTKFSEIDNFDDCFTVWYLILSARETQARLRKLRPLAEWHEDMGPVLWHCRGEAPWVGTPLDSDWPGYHTLWTELLEPDWAGGLLS